MGSMKFCVFLISIFFSGCLCLGSDTILAGQSLYQNQTIISKQGKFELASLLQVNQATIILVYGTKTYRFKQLFGSQIGIIPSDLPIVVLAWKCQMVVLSCMLIQK